MVIPAMRRTGPAHAGLIICAAEDLDSFLSYPHRIGYQLIRRHVPIPNNQSVLYIYISTFAFYNRVVLLAFLLFNFVLVIFRTFCILKNMTQRSELCAHTTKEMFYVFKTPLKLTNFLLYIKNAFFLPKTQNKQSIYRWSPDQTSLYYLYF